MTLDRHDIVCTKGDIYVSIAFISVMELAYKRARIPPGAPNGPLHCTLLDVLDHRLPFTVLLKYLGPRELSRLIQTCQQLRRVTVEHNAWPLLSSARTTEQLAVLAAHDRPAVSVPTGLFSINPSMQTIHRKTLAHHVLPWLCRYGRLDAIQLLFERIELGAGDVSLNIGGMLGRACEGGHLSVVQYLVAVLCLTPADIQAAHVSAARLSGNAALVQYLTHSTASGASDVAGATPTRAETDEDVYDNGPLPTHLTVALSGAEVGDVLQGLHKDTQNVRLRVAEGAVAPHARHRAAFETTLAGGAALVQLFKRHFHTSDAVATQMIAARVPRKQDGGGAIGATCPPRHATIEGGCHCAVEARFQILQPGVWIEFAEEAEHGAEMRAIVDECRIVAPNDILRLVGKKLLIMRGSLFEVVNGPQQLAAPPPVDSPHPLHVYAAVGPMAETVAYAIVVKAAAPVLAATATGGPKGRRQGVTPPEEIERQFVVTVDVAEPGPVHTAAALVTRALPAADPAELALALAWLQPMSAGALKSVLQKTIRLRAARVALLDGGVALVPTGGAAVRAGPGDVDASMFAATAAVVLALSPGGFVPDLQQYVGGAESAFKRLGVTLVEDAWRGGPVDVARALGVALVLQRVPGFRPASCMLVWLARTAAAAQRSAFVLAWRDPASAEAWFPVDAGGRQHLWQSAHMLDALGSFSGDRQMMHVVARLSAEDRLPLNVDIYDVPVGIMPAVHLFDQHMARGIAHALHAPDALPTFHARFRYIFDGVTGCNPRLKTWDARAGGSEAQRHVHAVRAAQALYLGLLLQGHTTANLVHFVPPWLRAENVEPTALVDGGLATVRLPLDPGVLAAAAGPIPTTIRTGRTTRELLVLLGTHQAEDEIVMLKPSRAKGRQLFDWDENSPGAELDRTTAIAQVRAAPAGVALHSALLPASARARFSGDQWCINGRPWADIVRDGIPLDDLPRPCSPPVWATKTAHDTGLDVAALLVDDNALYAALRARYAGCVAASTGMRAAAALVAGAPVAVATRALGALRRAIAEDLHTGQRFGLPTPSLTGGLAPGQLLASPGDWDAWRLLVLLRRLAPGAYRPLTPPNFAVEDPRLLHLLAAWARSPQASPVLTHGPVDAATPRLPPFSDLHAQLHPHQRDAVARMVARDRQGGAQGHYMVMNTGMGKTVTALSFFSRQLAPEQGSEAPPAEYRTVRHVLWVTPPGQKMGRGKTFTLVESQSREMTQWGLPRANLAAEGGHDVLENAKTDRIRAGRLTIIHHDQLRDLAQTGELQRVAPSSVVVFDEVDQMYNATLRTSAALQLAETCVRFVAMTATPMTSIVERLAAWLGLTQQYPVNARNYLVAASEMVAAQLALDIARRYEVVRVPMTARVATAFRRYLHDNRWLELARVTQDDTDEALLAQAVAYARADRATYPDGGVLLVADSSAHAERLLEDLHTRGVVAGGPAVMAQPEMEVVVVSKTNARGYNGAIRLGAVVRGVYAGNASDRHQMEGRIHRIGQRRRAVDYVVVVMQGTMLDLLHARQETTDAINASLEQFARRYAPELMAMARNVAATN
jgi:hypothetical protein